MFQFTGLASRLLGISCLQQEGLPHSEISGSKVICTSPKLIAAYHVLRRLWEPRHSPYALNYFLSNFPIKDIVLILMTNSVVFSFNMSKNFWGFPVNWSGRMFLTLTPILKLTPSSWRIRESNPWPPACRAGALANWANSPSDSCSPGQSWTVDPYIISVVL